MIRKLTPVLLFLFLLVLASCSVSAAGVSLQLAEEPTIVHIVEEVKPAEEVEETLIIGCMVGNIAPEFTLLTEWGKKVSLSDYEGSPVLLTFWKIYCPSCRTEVPHLQRAYSNGLQVLAVNVADHKFDIREFTRINGITYPIALGTRSIVRNYSLIYVPMSFLIDEKGIVTRVEIGGYQEEALND